MAIKVEMPKLSDTMDEGVLVSWTAEEGDAVSAGDVIAQVETDKATMDLEVYDDGVLLKKVADEGDAVPLGGLIAVLGQEGEDISDILAESEDGSTQSTSESEDKEQESNADAKRTAEAGKPKEEEKGPGRATPFNENVETRGSSQRQKGSEAGSGNGRMKVSPLARRLAGEHGVDLGQIRGSGPEGRIIKRDIEAKIDQPLGGTPPERAAASPATQPHAPEEAAYRRPDEVLEGDELYESADISQMRKTIARRLAQSKFSAPHFYLTVDVDMERAASFRKEVNARADSEQGATRISFNDLVTKACAAALRRHPQVNASYLAEEGELRYYKQVHVAVAVAIEEGLVTPVVRHADRKGLRTIAEETREKATRARSRELELAEMEGSTFTTSNLGMFGIEEFTAVINPPNACILAIGAVRDVPVVRDGEVVPGKRMRLTLSCDHRIVDGATGARFLDTVKDYLEEPLHMLL